MKPPADLLWRLWREGFTQSLSKVAWHRAQCSDSKKRPVGTGHNVGGNTAGTCCVGFQLTRKKKPSLFTISHTSICATLMRAPALCLWSCLLLVAGVRRILEPRLRDVFANDMVLLASSVSNIQDARWQFAPTAAGMRVASNSEAKFLCRENGALLPLGQGWAAVPNKGV